MVQSVTKFNKTNKTVRKNRNNKVTVVGKKNLIKISNDWYSGTHRSKMIKQKKKIDIY